MSLELVARVDAAELSDGVFVVSVHGPLDVRAAGELRDVLVPLAGSDGAALLLDLEDAHGLDRPALDVIATAAHVALHRGERLRLITRSAVTRELVRECGLEGSVEVVSSLREALRA